VVADAGGLDVPTDNLFNIETVPAVKVVALIVAVLRVPVVVKVITSATPVYHLKSVVEPEGT
jgi:hypothetical protein